ncbi:PLD nuclease N-terminal domain-containing protein [Streptomyces sp. WMMB 322]|uniref:PLD nuclease N-terminal domain-containing protein n=1 Tax=Streptomyces sp. WMMB 322 TaxID=1286821 RepID=UPI000823C639|nr:PLD nuclease N-terminal domain-containing protein [Streptomyces sp. WMMB 322]SCK51510.1 Phospholipase_D-nuclease N-terminal [Streptomyces sp. WMMB 322]
MLRYLPFILVLAVWIYAFIDCLNTPEKEVRKLPKVVWIIIVLLFGQVLLGPVAWFAVGRPRKNAPYGATRPDERRWVAPDDNPEFLKSIKGGAQPDGSQDDGTPGDERNAAGGKDGADAGPDAGKGDRPDAGKGRVTDEDTGAAGREPRPGAEPQEAELHRRDEESGRREDGKGGPDETPPKS